jgi:hypothetical protein
MKRRYRRRLFNAFAFLTLGVAIYLNMFCMENQNSSFATMHVKIPSERAQTKGDKMLKIIPAKSALPVKPS